MPQRRTPRELLLAALERRRLTGFRSSHELAWVVFPPQSEGGVSVQVIHVPRIGRFRVISANTAPGSTEPATTLGDFRTVDEAAACVEHALEAASDDTADLAGRRLAPAPSQAPAPASGQASDSSPGDAATPLPG